MEESETDCKPSLVTSTFCWMDKYWLGCPVAQSVERAPHIRRLCPHCNSHPTLWFFAACHSFSLLYFLSTLQLSHHKLKGTKSPLKILKNKTIKKNKNKNSPLKECLLFLYTFTCLSFCFSMCFSELIQTEFHHVRTLRIMEGVYRRGMQEEVMLEAGVVHTIFPCLDQLLEWHSSFLSELLTRRKEGLMEGSTSNFTVHRIGDLLLRQVKQHRWSVCVYSLNVQARCHVGSGFHEGQHSTEFQLSELRNPKANVW